MEINKDIGAKSLFTDTKIAGKVKFDPDFFMYYSEKHNSDTAIFPLDERKHWRPYDQFLLLGHYLYSVNEDFRNAYLESYEKDFILDKNYNLKFFIKDYFNLFLYGFVVATYVKNMSDTPLHFLTRPVADEPNESLRDFLKKETERTHRPAFNRPGAPFYCYIRKKAMIIPNSMGPKFPPIILSEIKQYTPQLKNIAETLNEFAKLVYKELYETQDPEIIKFLSLFTSETWAPYLEDK